MTFPGFEGGQAVSASSDKEAAADRAAADARVTLIFEQILINAVLTRCAGKGRTR